VIWQTTFSKLWLSLLYNYEIKALKLQVQLDLKKNSDLQQPVTEQHLIGNPAARHVHAFRMVEFLFLSYANRVLVTKSQLTLRCGVDSLMHGDLA